MIDASIVVGFYNACQTLFSCLEALVKQSYKTIEIILVDNNSTDGSRKVVEDFIEKYGNNRFKVIEEKKQGIPTARNTGIKHSSGKIIACTDADCVADKEWVRKIMEVFKEENIDAVAGRIEGYRPSNLIEQFLSLFTLKTPDRDEVFGEYTGIRGGFATTNLSFTRKVYDEIGGFDEKLISGEDHDFCARFYQKGYKLKYSTKPLVYHIHRKDFKGFARQSYKFACNHALYLRRYLKGLRTELPGFIFTWKRFPFKVWINLAAADKKIIGIIILGFIWRPLFFLLPLYLFYLMAMMDKRCKKAGWRTTFLKNLEMAFLLIVKSFIMTMARVVGSFKYKVICL